MDIAFFFAITSAVRGMLLMRTDPYYQSGQGGEVVSDKRLPRFINSLGRWG